MEGPDHEWTRKGQGKPAAGSESAAGEGLRVLLAEDTPISAEMMLAMANRLSVRMDTAANGLEAIDMVEEAAEAGEPYSLLLVDIMMPILDGIETTRRLREGGYAPEELPIVAITAATDFEEIRSYRLAGMQAFLEKPVSLADLQAALQAWGHRSRKRVKQALPSALDALMQQFRLRMNSTLKAIRTALDADDLADPTVVELRRLLHQLAGTAGSFGESELGEEARAFEIELMAAHFEGTDIRDVLERAAQSIADRIGP